MKTAWWTWLAVGTSTAALVALGGCVVTSDDDGTGGSAGSAGSAGSGGSSGSGGATGGSGGATGGTGGTTDAGTGGSAGSDAGKITCTPDDPNDNCQVCTEQKCCQEFEACYVSGENCGFGGPKGEGEINCMFVYLTANPGEKVAAANNCVTPGQSIISTTTNNLFNCLDTQCLTECIP